MEGECLDFLHRLAGPPTTFFLRDRLGHLSFDILFRIRKLLAASIFIDVMEKMSYVERKVDEG